MMKATTKTSPAAHAGRSSKKSPATIKAVTRFLDSASTAVWEGVKEGASLSNVVATKIMSQTGVNDVLQREHYNRSSGGGGGDENRSDDGDGDGATRTHSSPRTTHRNGGGGAVKERIKIFNTTLSPPKSNSHTSHTSHNNNSPYQRGVGGGISGEQRRREYEASIPLPMPIPLPIRNSITATATANNSHSSLYVRRGDGNGNNKHRDNQRTPTAATVSTTTGRHHHYRQHDHYDKENDTNTTAAAAAAAAATSNNSKRIYHAGMDNFVSVLKSSSPKKLRKQQNESKKMVKEEGRCMNHYHPKHPKKEEKDHRNDERESNSDIGCNLDNHVDNDTSKAGEDQSNSRYVITQKQCNDGISLKRWQDDAYLATTTSSTASSDLLPMTTREGVNDNNSSSNKMKKKKKKQRMGINNYIFSSPLIMYQHHSLIQSPLQRHIMAVHESACSNATCTVMKKPFQLHLVPSSSSGEEMLAAATARTRQGGGGGEDDHLDMLGAVAGHSVKYKKNGNTNDPHKNIEGNVNNTAIDLLTSAAFLFKTSRRNIL